MKPRRIALAALLAALAGFSIFGVLVWRSTEVELRDLGLTPGELARYGPAVVIEETRANGDRVLIWTR